MFFCVAEHSERTDVSSENFYKMKVQEIYGTYMFVTSSLARTSKEMKDKPLCKTEDLLAKKNGQDSPIF